MNIAATKTNVAYDRARRDIVTGVIAANEAIDEVVLGQRYGLGRTPIREALKQLRNDQLIVWPDRRSPYVPEIGVAQVKSLYEARSIFETQIATLAAKRITEDAAARLDGLVAQQADFVERHMAYEAAEVDLLFHKGVAEATGNQFLVDASTRVNISALRISACIASLSSRFSTSTCARDSKAPFSSKLGFSVVAPTSVTVPRST